MKDIRELGGYTTFVADGLIGENYCTVSLSNQIEIYPVSYITNRCLTLTLIYLYPFLSLVNRTEDLELPCKNSGGVMVESCNEDNINNGYERFPLGVRAGSGPNCKYHNNPNPYDGYVALQCDLSLDMTFGPTTRKSIMERH